MTPQCLDGAKAHGNLFKICTIYADSHGSFESAAGITFAREMLSEEGATKDVFLGSPSFAMHALPETRTTIGTHLSSMTGEVPFPVSIHRVHGAQSCR